MFFLLILYTELIFLQKICEMYESVAARENGIESVKTNAPDASVVDLT